MELTKDMFDQIIQDYEQLEQRAREVFKIYGEYFDTEKQYIDSIDVNSCTTEITTSWYSYGEHNNDYCSFPSRLLLEPDENIHLYFQNERKLLDEQRVREKLEREQKERERTEKYEREQLAKLLAKYCGDKNETTS